MGSNPIRVSLRKVPKMKTLYKILSNFGRIKTPDRFRELNSGAVSIDVRLWLSLLYKV